MPTREEFKEYQKQKLQAEIQGKPFNYVFKGMVKDLPENFQQYYNENKDKIATYKQKPYWLRDNERLIYRQENKNLYVSLKNNKHYNSVEFDEKTGGLKAIHKGHISHNNDSEEKFFLDLTKDGKGLSSTELEK